jgi:predicted DNA-binding protein (MmcQ/YjbR family)
MNHKQLIQKGLEMAGTSLQYPFDPQLPVLFAGKRMFALLGKTGEHESVNLKAEPEEAWLLRQQYPGSILPGYHMNMKHWNTVIIDGAVPDKEILVLLEQSYQLVCSKMTKREREKL